MGTLVANLSSEKASWQVERLTPDTDLRLRIYSTSLSVRSVPVVLIARTRNPYGPDPSSEYFCKLRGFHFPSFFSDFWGEQVKDLYYI